MNTLDSLLLLILGLSAVLSLWRGFVREAISLAGVVLAFLVASRASPQAAEWLSGWIPVRPLAQVAGFALVFVLVTLAAGLVGALARKLIDAADLTATDRLLGLLFGLTRGALLIALAFLAYDSYAGGRTPPWMAESRLAPYAMQLGEAIGRLIPRGYPLSRRGVLDRGSDIPDLDRKRLQQLIERQLSG